MKKLALILVMLLVMESFSFGQLNSIEIKDVNVNDNSIQILIENNFNQNFNKEVFVINGKNEILQENELKAFEAKYFIVNYETGIRLETLQVIINDNTADYLFTGNEDKFVINQEVSSTTTTESNSPISYVYASGRVAKIQDNQIVYYSSDNIGSTSLETDSSGSVNFKANYLPFGKELSFSSINKEKYGFTGKEYDIESSLNYFNARYYNPSNGKFISNDPIYKVTEGGYQYVRNNPLTITDPSGMQDVESFGKTLTTIKYPKHGVIVKREDHDKSKDDINYLEGFNPALSDQPIDTKLDQITPIQENVPTYLLSSGEEVRKKYYTKVMTKSPEIYRGRVSKLFPSLVLIPMEFFDPVSLGRGNLPLASFELAEAVIELNYAIREELGLDDVYLMAYDPFRPSQKGIANKYKAKGGKSTHMYWNTEEGKYGGLDFSIYYHGKRVSLIGYRFRGQEGKDIKAILDYMENEFVSSSNVRLTRTYRNHPKQRVRDREANHADAILAE